MYFDHIGDHVTVCQRIVNSVMSLSDSIADVGSIIPGTSSSRVFYPAHGLFHKLVQMGTSRVAVAEGAFHHDLGLLQIGGRPAHTEL